MSKIGDAVIQAEEEKLEGWKGQWQEDTRKMHELQNHWDEIYSHMDGVIGKVRHFKKRKEDEVEM